MKQLKLGDKVMGWTGGKKPKQRYVGVVAVINENTATIRTDSNLRFNVKKKADGTFGSLGQYGSLVLVKEEPVPTPPLELIGPKGDRGERGLTGLPGDRGDKGEVGLMGPKGGRGDRGENGYPGKKGQRGSKGDKGGIGPVGQRGKKGDPGISGSKGEEGERGERGEKGKEGEKGEKGDRGLRGKEGQKGRAGGYAVWGLGGRKARDVSIEDIGDYFTGLEVETALQEIGAGTTLDSRYINDAVDVIKDTHIDWGTAPSQVSAVDLPIADAGAYYTGTEVETALSEIGAGTTLNGYYPLRSEWKQNGFPNRADSSISFSDGTKRFTINPSSSSFDYFIAGVKYTVSSSDVVNVNYVYLGDTPAEGPWWIYYSGSTLTATLSPNHAAVKEIYENKATIAIVFWDADNSKGQLLEDRHGLSMSPLTHILIHETVGTRFDTGLALNNIDADQNGSADSHAQFGVDAGQIFDEDLEITLNAIGSTTGLQIWYQDTSGWTFTTNADFSMVTAGTGRLAYDNSGTLTEVTNNYYVLCHVFATTMSHNNPVVAIGQAQYSTKKSAQQGALTEITSILSIANISPELKPIASVIFHTNNNYSNAVKAKIVSTDEGDDYVDFRTDALNPAFSSAQEHGNLSGLSDDDHTQYILHSLADAANDFLVASGDDNFVKKTLAETGAILEGDIDHGNLQGLDTGADHSYIDQDVTSGSSPTFDGTNFTGIDISAGTNLAVTAPIVLTDDTLSLDQSGISHDSIADVSVDDHHAQSHNIVSHSDTTVTGTELETLTDNSMADALHRHSELSASDGTPDQAVCVDATGYVGIGTTTPTVHFHVQGRDMYYTTSDFDTGEGTGSLLEFSFGAETGNTYASLQVLIGSWNDYGDLTLQPGGGKLGIGDSSPSTILDVVAGSATDPVADAWDTHCGRGDQKVLKEIHSDKLDILRNVKVYSYKKIAKITEEQAIVATRKDKPTKKEIDAKRAELLAEREEMPKFTTERVGVMMDDEEIPSEMLTFDKEGNKTGISLVGWVGYLQAALKEAGNRIADLEKILAV